MSTTILPTNPEDLRQMKSMVVEMTNCLQRIEDEKEQMKDIAEACEEKFAVQKKYLTKLARVMFKHSYADLQTENEHFEFLYEAIVESKKIEE